MRTSFEPARPSGIPLGARGQAGTSDPPPEARGRDLRLAADARLDAFVCEVPHPALFRTQPGDASPIDLSDVQQGKYADCFFLAPLGALTRTEAGRALIRHMISENRDPSGKVVSYTVTLHETHASWLRAEGFKEVRVMVDARFDCFHARERNDGDASEVWPLVIEAAYLKLTGGDRRMTGGDAGTAMLVLTGKLPDSFGLHWYSRRYDAEALKADLAGGKIVVFDTKSDIERGPYNLVGRHSYAVVGTEERDGKQYVLLHNPYNTDEPRPVPFDGLRDYFNAIHVGRVP
jgi:Calpain family cysteine protease